MSDDSAARRDAWREAQTATTVTGRRTGSPPPSFGSHGELLGLLDEVVPDPTHETAQVTHPSNAAPGHPALTNVGTIYDCDADDSPGVVREAA
jgi:hypothetical protein